MPAAITRDTRAFATSALLLVLVVGLLICLTVVEIPAGNREVVITGFGALIGGLTGSLKNLFDRDAEDLERQKQEHDKEMQELRLELAEIRSKYEATKTELDRITRMLVSRTTDVDRPEFANTQPARFA